MEYTFKKLADVEALTEVPEAATVIAEVDGEIKRIPGSGLGGSDIKTAIIKDSGYDNTLAGLQTAVASAPSYTYSCLNMTFEEAYETMAMGEPLDIFFMLTSEGALNIHGFVMFAGTMMGVPCLLIGEQFMDTQLYWTADGLSTEAPSSAN